MSSCVVVDIDGVLADFEGAFCEKFGWERRELVSLESRYPSRTREINKFINDGEVYKNLKPIKLGMEIVEYLHDEGFDVHVVTGRPFGFESITRAWLNRHRVNYWSFALDTHKTGKIAQLKPLCAVDDLFSVHTALLKHNIPTILVAQPWNQYSGENLRRISNLTEFISEFEQVI
jgi:hypothetical protein